MFQNKYRIISLFLLRRCRIVSLFLLSRQLLSSQQHYDWGLRALKPILPLAGRLLQEIKAAQSEPLREDEEAVLLLKAGLLRTAKDSYGELWALRGFTWFYYI